jgi:hypothetical protein
MDVKQAILVVLPALSHSVASDVAHSLETNVGVETIDDLRFVEAADLNQLLKLIQVRKLISSWKMNETGRFVSTF